MANDAYTCLNEEEVRELLAVRARRIADAAYTESRKAIDEMITPMYMALAALEDIENKKMKAVDKLRAELDDEILS